MKAICGKITMANKEKAEMEEAIKTCTLPDKPDYEAINKLLIEARKEFYDKKQESPLL